MYISSIIVRPIRIICTIYNSLCVRLSLLFVAVFQSSPKAVGGRQYERTTDTFGFCKILFSHFSPLMIIIMFSSNTFKMLRNSDEEFENILAPNGILHWRSNCAQSWPDKFIRDYWEIFGNIFGILYWCSNCARSLPDQLNQAPEIHLGYNFTENSEEQT